MSPLTNVYDITYIYYNISVNTTKLCFTVHFTTVYYTELFFFFLLCTLLATSIQKIFNFFDAQLHVLLLFVCSLSPMAGRFNI